MTDAAAQLRRLLDLIPRCADDQPHRIDEVAREAGTDPRTLLRDLRALSERFDDPGGFVEGVQIFVEADRFQVRSDHFLRPMRLTVAELGALELGLSLLAMERPPEEHAAIAGARERLRAALAVVPDDPPDGDLFHAGLPESADPRVLATIRSAIHDSRRVRIRYRKAGAGAGEDRTVPPLGVVHNRGRWYLVAMVDDAEQFRVYRLDRVEEAEVTAESFAPPEGFSLDAVLPEGPMFLGSPGDAVRIRYMARIARWIAEREGVNPAADGTVTVEHPLADLEWAVAHVLQYGPEAVVVEPEAVREEIRKKLREVTGDREETA